MLFSFNVLYQFITRIFESLTSTMHLVQTIQEKSQYLHIHYFDCEFDSYLQISFSVLVFCIEKHVWF